MNGQSQGLFSDHDLGSYNFSLVTLRYCHELSLLFQSGQLDWVEFCVSDNLDSCIPIDEMKINQREFSILSFS